MADPEARALELLAAAVAGRRVPLEHGRQGVHTDGATVFVDAGSGAGPAELRRAVIAQAALIATSALGEEPMRRLARATPESARRYLGLEVVRASRELDAVLPREFQAAVAPYSAHAGVTGSAEESLRRALGRGRLEDPPHWFGTLHPRAALRTARHGGGAAPSDDELAAASRMALRDHDPEPDEPEERAGLLDRFAMPLKSPLGHLLQRMLGARSSGRAGVPGTGTGDLVHRSAPGPLARPVAGSVPMSAVTVGGQLTRGRTYPEWDHRSEIYRPGWCTVGDFDPPPDAEVPLPPAAAHPRLLRELSRLGLTWRPHDREAVGDELDLTALVDYRIGVATGTAGEPRVYRAERRTARELGVLVLLDATGSSTEHAAGRAAFEEQRELTHLLTTALDRLGARVATYAFYSRGRDNVRVLRCKSFEDRWTGSAHRRLFSVRPTGFTRMGAVIRHGTELLDAQAGTRRRLLVVIGDGVAYDDGYEGQYAVEDCRRAVREARARAVGCVGIATRSTGQVGTIWPAEAHCVATTGSELAKDVRTLFGTALRRCEGGS